MARRSAFLKKEKAKSLLAVFTSPHLWGDVGFYAAREKSG
jgi:hypothetical protein